jgi:ferredoxin/flavodoxin---NADP+ reductase
MNNILVKKDLSELVHLMVVKAPLVAAKARAGQFVIVRIDETGERIPLTIADINPSEGTVTLIFQEVGKTTMQMGLLAAGDHFENVVGPLGRPTEVKKYGKVALVGGGIGVAPLYPIARALKDAGNIVFTIIGARTKALLFWEERMQACSDKLIVCTDDGSYGRHALVTGPFQELLASEKELARAWAIGPAIMMKAIADASRPFNLPTLASLNTIMIDGTGMCGGCRVVMNDGVRFVCVDGPEFDAHQIDWNVLLERLKLYREEERLAIDHWKSHTCKLDPALTEALR